MSSNKPPSMFQAYPQGVPNRQAAPQKGQYNPYHVLTRNTYQFFCILAIVGLGIGAILTLAGAVCPYWNVFANSTTTTTTTTAPDRWGPFTCSVASNITSCTGKLTFSTTSNKNTYSAVQAMTGLALALGLACLGLVVYLLIRMRSEKLFDSLQKYLTYGALAAGIIAAIFGFADLGLAYYVIANSENMPFSASDSACGIVFGVGILLLCFGLIFVFALVLFRETQEAPPEEPVRPKPVQQQQQPQPQFVQWPKPADQPRILPTAPTQTYQNGPDGPVVQIFRQDAPVPQNPYGYNGDPYHDTQMHWMHRWYHHFAYNRPTWPYLLPANTVPPRQ